MLTISRCNVVALEMKCNVAKSIGVAVDVQCPYVASSTAIVVQLLAEEMRKV
jgi:hypothetical protein